MVLQAYIPIQASKKDIYQNINVIGHVKIGNVKNHTIQSCHCQKGHLLDNLLSQWFMDYLEQYTAHVSGRAILLLSGILFSFCCAQGRGLIFYICYYIVQEILRKHKLYKMFRNMYNKTPSLS